MDDGHEDRDVPAQAMRFGRGLYHRHVAFPRAQSIGDDVIGRHGSFLRSNTMTVAKWDLDRRNRGGMVDMEWLLDGPQRSRRGQLTRSAASGPVVRGNAVSVPAHLAVVPGSLSASQTAFSASDDIHRPGAGIEVQLQQLEASPAAVGLPPASAIAMPGVAMETKAIPAPQTSLDRQPATSAPVRVNATSAAASSAIFAAVVERLPQSDAADSAEPPARGATPAIAQSFAGSPIVQRVRTSQVKSGGDPAKITRAVHTGDPTQRSLTSQLAIGADSVKAARAVRSADPAQWVPASPAAAGDSASAASSTNTGDLTPRATGAAKPSETSHVISHNAPASGVTQRAIRKIGTQNRADKKKSAEGIHRTADSAATQNSSQLPMAAPHAPASAQGAHPQAVDRMPASMAMQHSTQAPITVPQKPGSSTGIDRMPVSAAMHAAPETSVSAQHLHAPGESSAWQEVAMVAGAVALPSNTTANLRRETGTQAAGVVGESAGKGQPPKQPGAVQRASGHLVASPSTPSSWSRVGGHPTWKTPGASTFRLLESIHRAKSLARAPQSFGEAVLARHQEVAFVGGPAVSKETPSGPVVQAVSLQLQNPGDRAPTGPAGAGYASPSTVEADPGNTGGGAQIDRSSSPQTGVPSGNPAVPAAAPASVKAVTDAAAFSAGGPLGELARTTALPDQKRRHSPPLNAPTNVAVMAEAATIPAQGADTVAAVFRLAASGEAVKEKSSTATSRTHAPHALPAASPESGSHVLPTGNTNLAMPAGRVVESPQGAIAFTHTALTVPSDAHAKPGQAQILRSSAAPSAAGPGTSPAQTEVRSTPAARVMLVSQGRITNAASTVEAGFGEVQVAAHSPAATAVSSALPYVPERAHPMVSPVVRESNVMPVERVQKQPDLPGSTHSSAYGHAHGYAVLNGGSSALSRVPRDTGPGKERVSLAHTVPHSLPPAAMQHAAGANWLQPAAATSSSVGAVVYRSPATPMPSGTSSPGTTRPASAGQMTAGVNATAPAHPPGKDVDVNQLANRVYDLLVRRLASERQRRGA
jgi:hypothetical protein